jgi:hypothetical protein
MSLPFSQSNVPEALLYFTQAGTYAMAFRAAYKNGDAPGHFYLYSCLIHAALGVLLCSSRG